MSYLQLFNKIPSKQSLPLLLLISSPFSLLAQDEHIDLTVYQNGATYEMGFSNSEPITNSLQGPGLAELKSALIRLSRFGAETDSGISG